MKQKSNFYQSHNIHPNAPRRLVTALHKAGWNERELARQRKVNISYVSKLLRLGEEPTDRTEKGQEMRVKLFLPKRKPKPRIERAPLPEWLVRVKKKIAYMAKQTRQDVLRRLE